MNEDLLEQAPNRPRVGSKASVAKSWLKAIELTSRIEADPSRLFADVVDEWSSQQPERPALISEATTFTYRMLAERINRYARWALAAGIQTGDVVCLVMPNRPDAIAAWLGITRIGGVAALINTRLVGPSLSHCINLANPEHVILADDLAEVFETALPYLNRSPTIWIQGRHCEGVSIDAALEALDGSPLRPAERRGVTINDRALLIYTSGTTGLPKAANISHRRILNWGGWFAGLTGATLEDRLYDCLPVYHSVGGIVAPCSMLVGGRFGGARGKILRKDLLAGNRALRLHAIPVYRRALPLSSEGSASEYETQHRLRLACGNGLRGDIWETFRARFSIPRILEFYAATEGNFSLYNVEGKAGRDRAAFRRCSRIVSRRRSCASTSNSACRFAPRMGFALPALAARSAKPSAGSEPPMRAAAASRVIPTPPRPKRRSCATCSQRAMPGFVPAI